MNDFDIVIKAMEQIAPLSYADTTWDNVGIMVETPLNKGSKKVMLTIDFTESVLKESIDNEVSVVLSYHPPIFRPLKSLKLSDHKQMLLLTALANGMSIYSPHSALDAAPEGINEWLGSAVPSGSRVVPEPEQPYRGELISANGNCTIEDVVTSFKTHLKLSHMRLALCPSHDLNTKVNLVALCAGSGSSVVTMNKGCTLYITGEMSHHEVLAANASGVSVLLSEHTCTERGYLEAKLQPRLSEILGKDYTVMVSKSDFNPINIV